MSFDYPEIGEAIAVHDALLDEFGGASGIRDESALASALMRPQLGCYHTPIDEAASLMESLANNAPFVKSNKRTAFAGADTFLRLNGHSIDCAGDEATELFMRLFQTSYLRFALLHAWLQQSIRPLPQLG